MDDLPERALAALEKHGGWYGVLRALDDAKRYRWLCTKHNERASAITVMCDQFTLEDAYGVAEGGLDLDAAVAAAMRAEGANT